MSLSSLASARKGLIRKSLGHAITRKNAPRIAHPSRGHVHADQYKIGPRGVPPISICVQGKEVCVVFH